MSGAGLGVPLTPREVHLPRLQPLVLVAVLVTPHVVPAMAIQRVAAEGPPWVDCLEEGVEVIVSFGHETAVAPEQAEHLVRVGAQST